MNLAALTEQMADKGPIRLPFLQRDDRFVDDNEDRFNLPDNVDPLLNIFTVGWMQDGRLGYMDELAPATKGLICSTPRPVVALRPPSYVEKKAAEAKARQDAIEAEKKAKKAAESVGVKRMTAAQEAKMQAAEAWAKEQAAIAAAKAAEEEKKLAEKNKGKKVKEKKKVVASEETNNVVMDNSIKQFICKQVSAGAKHTLFLMVNCRPGEESWANTGDKLDMRGKRRTKKVMLSGLNQRGLCEEPGYVTPIEIKWDNVDEEPVYVCAGNGVSFVVDRYGNTYSFGNGKFGVLGHGDELSWQVPRQIGGIMQRQRVKKISAGNSHVLAMTYQGKIISWGRNNKGQLGLGFESPMVLEPTLISTFADDPTAYCYDVSCGFEFSTALVCITSRSGNERSAVYAWGDESRGQLGSGDKQKRSTPQENRWVTRLLKNLNGASCLCISAGGYHVLVATYPFGNLITWGAGDYGQLGHGFLWDDEKPNVVNDLKGVVQVAAGLRHSAALVNVRGATEVLTWGYNGYGECGLGDTQLRIQPTKSSAFDTASEVLQISSGERHMAFITYHRPITNREDATLRTYYEIMEETNFNSKIIRQLKFTMERKGLNPNLLDNPNGAVANQAGANNDPIYNDLYEKGLRYCLDTWHDPSDYRHKTYEVFFDCHVNKEGHIGAVCLSCARHCMAGQNLDPQIRIRREGDRCACRGTNYCMCAFSRVRSEFDRFAGYVSFRQETFTIFIFTYIHTHIYI